MSFVTESRWQPLPSHNPENADNTAYERPLGTTEVAFYWDAEFMGTADTVRYAEVRIISGNRDEVVNPERITKAWTSLKTCFPLLGARIEERGKDSVFFVVSEEWLQSCQVDEISFRNVSSSEDVLAFVDGMLVKGRPLSNNLLARLFVLQRKDNPSSFHLVFYVAHCITDGMGNIAILKTFLDELCGSSPPKSWTLKDRLALSVASEDLHPNRSLCISRRRWRNAIASVIGAARAAKLKGGHSLPSKVTHKTPTSAAHSKMRHCVISPESSSQIIVNCRQNGITFGSAYAVLGQVALSRVLLRRYLRGEFSEEEWEFRKREPMLAAGPLNLRPFLDKDWNEAGGSTHLCASLAFYIYHLPFLPLGAASQLRPGMAVPNFDALLSKKRLVLRSKMIIKQSNNFVKHPLFLEITTTSSPRRVDRMREMALRHRKHDVPASHDNEPILTPMEQASSRLVFGNLGSTMGNIDRILPSIYPSEDLPDTTGSVGLELVTSMSRLRCRPTELYLGAATTRGQLHLHVFWDSNVYDDEMVAELLSEVKMATEFYFSG